MSRKDYIRIAEALKAARQYQDRAANQIAFIHGCEACAVELANALSRDNPRFDRERFLKAAGVGQS